MLLLFMSGYINILTNSTASSQCLFQLLSVMYSYFEGLVLCPFTSFRKPIFPRLSTCYTLQSSSLVLYLLHLELGCDTMYSASLPFEGIRLTVTFTPYLHSSVVSNFDRTKLAGECKPSRVDLIWNNVLACSPAQVSFHEILRLTTYSYHLRQMSLLTTLH